MDVPLFKMTLTFLPMDRLDSVSAISSEEFFDDVDLAGVATF
jgi:hypothetical protein